MVSRAARRKARNRIRRLAAEASDGRRSPVAAAIEATNGEPAPNECRMSEETYVRERNTLIEIEQKSADQHDKSLLTLSTGALGLSLTFLDKIAPEPLPETIYLVAISWAFLILAILTLLLSFLVSQFACRRQRDLLDKEYSTGVVPVESNRPATYTFIATIAAHILFMAGVVFLAVFSWWNLSHRSREPHGTDARPSVEVTEQRISGSRLCTSSATCQRAEQWRAGSSPSDPPNVARPKVSCCTSIT